ncbi:MAG: hypothetical protein EBZ77_14770, partial [Chitinophagia bacterium]|nr:hypothetical protein [Chitinophagia bacterium]
MKAAFFALLFTLPALCCSSIAVSGREKTQKPGVQPKSPVNDTITGKRLYWGKRMDGYVVYRRDTIRGLIILHKKLYL